jgi:glycosyltransferase involved in cell wall biosynthesis
LVEAYRRYRSDNADPWGLTVCGDGPLGHLLEGVPGVRHVGFVPPELLSDELAEAGALVMPSWHDPWVLALVEGAAAGLPIIATNDCGSSVELVRDFYNGRLVATRDPCALAEAMGWISAHHHALPELGRRSMALANPYSAAAVSERWAHLLRELHRSSRRRPVEDQR